MRSIAIIICLVLILLPFSQTQAKIIHVPSDSSTIQGGINGAVNGDTVLVAPDIYYEHINFNGKAILVKSEAGAENTTIAKAYDGISIVTFSTGEDTTSVLDGFTITGGELVELGAGINCDSTSPKIRNNIITNNSATNKGGGFCCYTGHPILESNIIMNNTGDGGAIYLYDCDAHVRGNFINENFSGEQGGGGLFLYECNETTVEKNLIILNNATGLGGGILLMSVVNNLLVNNTFSENGAYKGGGICLWGARDNTLLNNIIVSSSSGYGITSNLTSWDNLIEFNDVWNNSPDEYYVVDPGDGCISADPLFCDPENDNYYIYDISPCVGTGQGGTDIGALGVGCDYHALGPFSLLLPPKKAFTPRGIRFDWENAVDPDPFNPVSYDLYVSTSYRFPPDQTTVDSNLTISEHIKTLDYGKYFWKVKAKDSWGAERWCNQTYYYFTVTGLHALPIGDFTGDSSIDVADLVSAINYLYRSGPAPDPLKLGDVTCDGEVNVDDVVYLISYLFRNGPPPCEP